MTYPNIVLPVSGQPVSSGSYGIPVKAAIDNLDSRVGALESTPWSVYTPSFTSTSGSTVMGTGGVLTGRYKQFGKSVFLSVYGLFGTSGATFGVGNWGWSLPVAANATNNMPRTGSAYFRDSSAAGSGHFVGICTIQPSLSVNTLNGFVPTGFAANTQVRETVPFTWAVNDFFALSIVYEAA